MSIYFLCQNTQVLTQINSNKISKSEKFIIYIKYTEITYIYIAYKLYYTFNDKIKRILRKLWFDYFD